MEKILILSDIHGGVRRAVEAVKMHRECQIIIFLGDGARHLDVIDKHNPDAAIFSVRGNCDTFLDGVDETEVTLEICSHRIFLCHGHTRGVKYGLGGLLSAAKEKRCDIALYGHTHIAHEEYDSDGGIYMFNPGSIGEARDGKYTFGILTLDEKNVLFSIGEV